MSAEGLVAGEVLIDRFRLIEKLGEGGFASVWLAEDTQVLGKRRVAIKVLAFERQAQADVLDRFIVEARLLCAMDHPTIAKAYDVYADQDVALYAMEFVEGVTLKSELGRRSRAKEPYSTAEILEIGFALSAALDHAHHHRIVHRDVKPTNVLLPPDGRARGAIAKLVDFGIAKDLARGDATTQGRLFGSWAYMAPEQALGTNITERTDVFGLACVMFEVVTLCRAWLRTEEDRPQPVGDRIRLEGPNSPMAITDRISRGARPSLTALRPGLPTAVDKVFVAALARDVLARPPSPDMFMVTLASALGVPASAWPKVGVRQPEKAPVHDLKTIEMSVAPEFARPESEPRMPELISDSAARVLLELQAADARDAIAGKAGAPSGELAVSTAPMAVPPDMAASAGPSGATPAAASTAAPPSDELPAVVPRGLTASDFPVDRSDPVFEPQLTAQAGDRVAQDRARRDRAVDVIAGLGPGMTIAKQESLAIDALDEWGDVRRNVLVFGAVIALVASFVAGALYVVSKAGIDRSVVLASAAVIIIVAATRIALDAYGHSRKQALRKSLEKWSDPTGLRFRIVGEDSGHGVVVDAELDDRFDGGGHARLRLRVFPYWRRSMTKLAVRMSTEMPPEARMIFGRPGEWRAFPLNRFVLGTLAVAPADAMIRGVLEEARSRLSSNDVAWVESDAYMVACDVRIRRLDPLRTAGELAAVTRSFLLVSRLLWKAPGEER